MVSIVMVAKLKVVLKILFIMSVIDIYRGSHGPCLVKADLDSEYMKRSTLVSIESVSKP